MQGIPEMHDIPTMRDVSAFTMVRNLIIGSVVGKFISFENQEMNGSGPR